MKNTNDDIFSFDYSEVFLLDFASVCLTDVIVKVTLRCIFIFMVLSFGWEVGEGLLMFCFGCKINLGIKPRQS